jgi:hypothetical protein
LANAEGRAAAIANGFELAYAPNPNPVVATAALGGGNADSAAVVVGTERTAGISSGASSPSPTARGSSSSQFSAVNWYSAGLFFDDMTMKQKILLRLETLLFDLFFQFFSALLKTSNHTTFAPIILTVQMAR